MNTEYAIVPGPSAPSAPSPASFGSGLPSPHLRAAGYEYVSTENAAEQYLATLGSKASVATVRSKLNRFAQFFGYPDHLQCDWHLMRYENVLRFLNDLRNRTGDAHVETTTINAYLCALKGIAQTAWNLNQITDRDLMRVKNIRQYRVTRKIAGKALTRNESSVFISQCAGDDPRHVRDRAILLLLLGCGLRRAEVTAIRLSGVHLDEGRIRLVGKGNKERDVFMNQTVRDAVEKWMNVRLKIIREWNSKNPWKNGNAGDGSSGFLFGKWTRNYGYLIVNRPLNPWTIGEIVNQYKSKGESQESGLREVTTHDLRRTYATRLLDKGVDISTVKNLMGHSSIATTTLYDRRGEEAMRRAADSVDL